MFSKRRKSSTKDCLRSSAQKSNKTINASRRLWYTLLASACSKNYFPRSCVSTNHLLYHTPSIPAGQIDEIVQDSSLSLNGFSKWRIDSAKICDLSSEMKSSRVQKVVIGVVKTNFCEISQQFLSTWVGFESPNNIRSNGNYIFALVLGWSYVLSTQLVELRRRTAQDKVVYTNERASFKPADMARSEGMDFSLPLGNVSSAEARWWAAILARECGWQAILHRGENSYYPPWSCHLKGYHVEIDHSPPENGLSQSAYHRYDPPSSGEALRYLCKFATLHNIHDQLVAAFVAVLTIPKQARFGTKIVLPKPHPMTEPLKHIPINVDQLPSLESLAYFMALSCIPSAMTSCMFGCFWYSGVECNQVSQWLHPLLQEILPSLILEKKWHTIVHILTANRPNSAPLWLGAAITGLLPRIIEIVAANMPPISLEAMVWTASPQSFMDPGRFSKVYSKRCRKTITRKEEYRLLYITDIHSTLYASPPLSPWPPFGTVALSNAALEVRLHAFCGHRLIYSHWGWEGIAEKTVEDRGAKPSQKESVLTTVNRSARQIRGAFVHYLQRPRLRLRHGTNHDESLSRSATRNIFAWALQDGTKYGDSELWEHEWVRDLLAIDTDEEASECSSSRMEGRSYDWDYWFRNDEPGIRPIPHG